MELIFLDSAKKELTGMPHDMKILFRMHLEKIHPRPPHKHMKQGIPSHVEKVTKQARIIFDFSEDQIYILHCFTNHKEYEQWYNSYK